MLLDPRAFSKLQSLMVAFDEAIRLDDYLGRVGLPTGGAVRVSLGIASNLADVYGFMAFATEFVDLPEVGKVYAKGEVAGVVE